MKMTREEIIKMPAGREMDVTIGYHVMDLVAPPEIYPEYSTDIAEAWRVVEKYQNSKIVKRGGFYFCDLDQEDYDYSQADTAQLAICKAALLAKIK
jgi:hypothetical protein